MKKAILVVSFGTSLAAAGKKAIDPIEDKIRLAFPAYDVRRAYSSHIIINKIKERDNIHIDNPVEALERLIDQEYNQVIVQPLHIIPGLEYQYLRSVVKEFSHKKAFSKIRLARPALYYKGKKDRPDDYKIFVDAMEEDLNKKDNFLLMAHGTSHQANECYLQLQQSFYKEGYKNVYIASLKGYPDISLIKERLIKDNVDQVILKPLMLVSGRHVYKDMLGDNKGSWQNILEDAGIKTRADTKSLGEIRAFQDIYIEHIREAIRRSD
ncbi:MAG: sirohydrochlorin cobaltochelatase [Epulopiscium sp.]|nr:sirohydrochlorin cobaltochelatase [Candidatus Epulonipiscium sp.]